MTEFLHGHVQGPPRANRLAPEILAQLKAGGASVATPDGTYGETGSRVPVVTVAGGKITGVTERPLSGGGGGGSGYFPSGW